jgi:hypothetical protein
MKNIPGGEGVKVNQKSQPFTKEPGSGTRLDKVLSLNPEMNGPWKWQGKEKPAGSPALRTTHRRLSQVASLEENLQPKLDSPRDIALAASFSEVAVT